MIVKSIYQLPSADINVSSYMEMSVPQNDLYYSRKVMYQDVRDDIQNSTSVALISDFGLTDEDGNKISVDQLCSLVSEIAYSDFTFRSKKEFETWPYISAEFPSADDDIPEYGDNFQYVIPNLKKVREITENNPVFMSTTSSLVAEGNPLPQQMHQTGDDSVVEQLEYGNTIGSGKFYFWQIDANQTDSSTSIHDADSGSTDGYEEIRDTGNLVVWGWLAEQYSPAPQPEQCWVAMYAKLKCENWNNTEMDVPVQVKPWIRGKNSSTIQYVSFNLPVRKGLRLKIKTGFPVNAQNSGLQNPGSLTFQDGMVPNAFFGYVIK